MLTKETPGHWHNTAQCQGRSATHAHTHADAASQAIHTHSPHRPCTAGCCSKHSRGPDAGGHRRGRRPAAECYQLATSCCRPSAPHPCGDYLAPPKHLGRGSAAVAVALDQRAPHKSPSLHQCHRQNANSSHTWGRTLGDTWCWCTKGPPSLPHHCCHHQVWWPAMQAEGHAIC
jgi:hypothetical protein